MAVAASRFRVFVHWAAIALGAVVVVALGRAVLRDGPAALAAWRAADVRWGWVTLGTACALAGQLTWVIGWKRLLTDCGVPAHFGLVARLFLVSNFGRYLPGGKAWQMGIVGVMAAENNLPAGLVAASSLVQGLVGVAVGALLLLATGGATLEVPPAWFALPVAGLAGLLLTPRVLRLLPRVRSAVVQWLPSVDTVTTATMWALVWTAALSWVAWGLGLYVLAVGILGDPVASPVTYVAAWIGPFLAGLIAFVAPAGLGVRDEVMRTMIDSAGVTPSAALAFIVVVRGWVTVVEVVPAVVVLVLRRRTPA